MSDYKQSFETILVKLDAETTLRPKRTLEAWILCERQCVLDEVNRLRGLRGFRTISISDVERAERLALGHSDYVRKYAHAAADLVFKEIPWA